MPSPKAFFRAPIDRLPPLSLLLLVFGLIVGARADAQVTFDYGQITLASYSSAYFLSPVAVDAQGDAFFVVSNNTNNFLFQVPANGTPIKLNPNFPFSPSAIAVNPQGTRLYFIYTPASANSCGGYVALATAPVSVGTTPTVMPCSFSLGNQVLSYSSPAGLGVDPSGNLWVADFGGQEFFEIPAPVSATSVPAKMAAIANGQPYDIAVNGNGSVYFTNFEFTGANAVSELASVPASSFVAGLPGSPAPVTGLVTNVPDIQSGLTVDPSGDIYLGGGVAADSRVSGNSLVNVYGNFVNGTSGLATDSAGDLYIAGSDTTGGQFVVELGVQAVNLGSVAVGSSSRTWSLSFSVAAGTTVGRIAVLATGVAGQDFLSPAGGTCTATTYASATVCTVNVTFKPLSPGQHRGAVVFYDSANAELADVPVYGIGTGPQAAFQEGAQTSIGSGLSHPLGLRTDAAGNAYIADYGNHRVVKVTPAGVQTTVGGGFSEPTGVAIDNAGNVFVADEILNAVFKVTPAGVLTTAVSGLAGPFGLAIDFAGNLYISEPSAATVYKVTPAGVKTTVGTGLSNPYDLALDPAGDLYIADYSSGNIYKVTPAGTQAPVATGINAPTGVALDAAGDLYVTSYGGGTLLEFAPGGSPVTLASGLLGPYAVALDPGGNLLFTQYMATTGLADRLVRATPPSLSFATTAGGATSTDSPRKVTLENIGNTSLAVSAVSYPVDFPETSSATDCTSSTSLAAAIGCTFTIDFSPVTVSSRTTSIPLAESVKVTTNSLNVSTAQTIPVTGTETKLAQSITFTPPTSVTYGAVPVDLSAHAITTSGLTISFKLVSGPAVVTGSMVSFTGVGTVVVQAFQLGNAQYAAANSINENIVVNKAVLSVFPHNLSSVYGAPIPTLTYVLLGLVNGDTQATATTGAPVLSTTATSHSAVGAYPIASALGTLAAANYSFKFLTETMTITKAVLQVFPHNLGKVYGAPLPTLTYVLLGFVNSDTQASATTGAPQLSTTATAGSPVGTYPIASALGTLAAANYSFKFLTETLTVNKASLSVTATSITVAFNASIPALTFTSAGYVNGDSSTVLTGTPSETTTAVKGSAAGQYPITITQGTLAAANYSFTFHNGTLTITASAPPKQ